MGFLNAEVPTLTTQRLTIRQFKAEDLDDFHEVLTGDPEWWDECSRSEAQEALAFRIRQASYNNPPLGYRAVSLLASQETIGTVGYESYFLGPEERSLYGEEPDWTGDSRRTLEFGVGYFVNANHRGHGYGSEAVRALIEYAFEQINVPRIYAETWHENAASIELMKRVGMKVGFNPDPDGWPGVFGAIGQP